MNSSIAITAEVIFNIAYLIVIWVLVALMANRTKTLDDLRRHAMGVLLLVAFGVLALGDTGHVGFRVAAYALGDLETLLAIGGAEMSLVGAGALATSITVTLFYCVLVELWRVAFRRERLLFWVVSVAAIARLALFFFPGNEWGRAVPPRTWSIVRNLPLLVQGTIVVTLFLRDGYRERSPMFTQSGWMIVVSFVCYIPVILFVERIPAIGMLMIPKTVAYLAVAWIGYRWIFGRRRTGPVAGRE